MDKRKRNIIIVITLVAIIGVIVFMKSASGLNEKSINKILDNKGEVASFITTEEDVKVDILGDIDKEDAKVISKDIMNLEKKSDKKLMINFLKDGTSSANEFYYDGLVNRAAVYEGSKEIEFESFINEKVEKSKMLNNYNEHKLLTAENNNLSISLNMDLKDIEDKEAVGQIKSYIEMFKNANKDKDIKSVQVSLKSSEKGYNYCDKNDDIYSIVEYLN